MSWDRFMLLAVLAVGLRTASAVGDARVTYTPLSEMAARTGQLTRYEAVAQQQGELTVGPCRVKYILPKAARAYDVIPIRYCLEQPPDQARWVAVEAVAFEAVAQAGGACFDLAVPGPLNVDIEYLGHVAADYVDALNIPLTPDGQSAVSEFPPIRRDALVRSGVVRAAPLIWFKFRLTNRGPTILDPEGLGASFAAPRIVRLDQGGSVRWTANVANLFLRHLDYLYPGDSAEFWACFNAVGKCQSPRYAWGLEPGQYRIEFRMLARFYRTYDWMTNIWGGTEFARLDVPITVAEEPAMAPVTPQLHLAAADNRMPLLFEAFEEFMTCFRTHPPQWSSGVQEQVMYLQVAPWTTAVTLKLVVSDPMSVTTVAVPLSVSDETLAIQPNADNIMVLPRNGGSEPVILAQPMPGMRTGLVWGPFPERHMRQRLQEMKDLGVNVIVNTGGDWHIHEMMGRPEPWPHAVSYKYFYDVLVDELDMILMGWSLYPPANPFWFEAAGTLRGQALSYATTGRGYGGHEQTIDMGEPLLPEVIAAWAEFNYRRWGQRWFRAADGAMPVDLEDTWGWMRDDINCRYRLGPLAVARFRQWLTERYGSIAGLNVAWGSSFAAWDAIDPEARGGAEGDGLDTQGLVYDGSDAVFYEWGPALEDWDRFRTELKLDIYRQTNELLRKRIPGAEIALRSEGSLPLVRGAPDHATAHRRHVYYAQRRNAMVLDVLLRDGGLRFFSDYTTLPYAQDEWAGAMQQMVDHGFVPGYLPQFDHMRDVLLNAAYGRSYQRHYDLETSRRGMQVHCLMAAFPWWRATYEAGGAPGILWEDYLCDGFATVTQKRELALLRDRFRAMQRMRRNAALPFTQGDRP